MIDPGLFRLVFEPGEPWGINDTKRDLAAKSVGLDSGADEKREIGRGWEGVAGSQA